MRTLMLLLVVGVMGLWGTRAEAQDCANCTWNENCAISHVGECLCQNAAWPWCMTECGGGEVGCRLSGEVCGACSETFAILPGALLPYGGLFSAPVQSAESVARRFALAALETSGAEERGENGSTTREDAVFTRDCRGLVLFRHYSWSRRRALLNRLEHLTL